jgi:hypothetical protein
MTTEATQMLTKRARFTTALAAGALTLLTASGTAVAKDANRDGIPDRWERRFGLSLRVDQSGRDQDHDSLDNLGEYDNRTNPRRSDSDHDGLDDGDEIVSGHDPRDDDSDDDGISDGHETAGEVIRYDSASGTLVIRALSGGRVSGVVTGATLIKCDDSPPASSSSQGSDDPPQHDSSDDSGAGGGGSGDACAAADLVPGATVHEAELEHGVWKKVELFVR